MDVGLEQYPIGTCDYGWRGPVGVRTDERTEDKALCALARVLNSNSRTTTKNYSLPRGSKKRR